METLDPSALTDVPSAVSFNCKPETVTLPGGVVSVAGVTVVTGGVELSCGSCILAFGFWGTLIGLSCVAVGLWDQLTHLREGTSHLLGLGFVILALSFVVTAGVAAFYLLTKKKRELTREEREDGKQVLVESGTGHSHEGWALAHLQMSSKLRTTEMAG
ncbi:unnamed protein product [Menidia menidia]|uniref:(Atlantic silverside) hypothetical protein n=1 Tax=Menidia menidia TaxID=238744 RepID=A0A8S4BKF2_9TELE|nr:unnamed protein product [Menidia menidia]